MSHECSPEEVALKTFFLGPKAENREWVEKQILNMFPSIPSFISRHITHRPKSLFSDDLARYHVELSAAIDGKSLLVIGGAGTIGSSFCGRPCATGLRACTCATSTKTASPSSHGICAHRWLSISRKITARTRSTSVSPFLRKY